METIVIKPNHQGSNSNPKERRKAKFSQPKQLKKQRRLVTQMPTFASREAMDAEVELETQIVSNARSQNRLPVMAPSWESDPSNENGPPLSQDDIDLPQESSPMVVGNRSRIIGVAILCVFSTILVGSMGAVGSHPPESQKSTKTAVRSADSPIVKSPDVAITDHSDVTASKSDSVAEPVLSFSQSSHSSQSIAPSVYDRKQEEDFELVEGGHLDEQVEHIEEVLQLADQTNQVPEVPTEETRIRFADETAALVAKVNALLGPPTKNIVAIDVPLPDLPVEQVERPVLKKPIKIVGIQKLGADQLRARLQAKTASVDLFRSIREFDNAKEFIFERESSNSRVLSRQRQARLDFRRKPTAQTNRPRQEHDPAELLSTRLSKRKDIQALPLTTDDQCRANAEEARVIRSVSTNLGRLISEASRRIRAVTLPNSGDGAALRHMMNKGRQDRALQQLRALVNSDSHPQYLKTTDQIFQTQQRQDRLEVINTLKEADNSTAINLLAKRGKYDLSADVRMAATNALAEFPRDQYRAEFLAGLKYPWHVVAQHSAEALVRLDDKKAIPELVEMLDLPNPIAPVEVEQDKYVQPTLVAINHMQNCLLCHAPSLSRNDIATGLVPNWDSPVPVQYYQDRRPGFVFVRADITYLRQDFSVVQPVANHGLWPSKQRFDYVVQQTALDRAKADRTKKKIAKAKNLNREAIIFALRKLSGLSPKDNSSESWKAILETQNAALLAQATQ